MSLITVLSLVSTFLNVAQADHQSDVKYALQILNDLPWDLAEPFCSSYGGYEEGEATSTWTVTAAPVTITTTLDCSETGGYAPGPFTSGYAQYSPAPSYADYPAPSEIYSPDYTSSEDYGYPDYTTTSPYYDYPEPTEDAAPTYYNEPSIIIDPIYSDVPTVTYPYENTALPEETDLTDSFTTITTTSTDTITGYVSHP